MKLREPRKDVCPVCDHIMPAKTAQDEINLLRKERDEATNKANVTLNAFSAIVRTVNERCSLACSCRNSVKATGVEDDRNHYQTVADEFKYLLDEVKVIVNNYKKETHEIA